MVQTIETGKGDDKPVVPIAQSDQTMNHDKHMKSLLTAATDLGILV